MAQSAEQTAGLRGLAPGARWGVSSTVLIQLSTMASTVVPARYLTPADFAIVGGATVVIGLFAVFTEAGFGEAVVLDRTAGRLKFSSTFWFAVAFGAVLAALAVLTAPLSARLIGNTEIVPFIVVGSLVLPLGIGSSVLQSVLLRDMKYRAVYVSQILQALATAVVPIVLVVGGAGPWSLIIGRVVGSAVIVLGLMVLGRTAPALVFLRSKVTSDLRFTSGVMGTSVLRYSTKNLDYWVLGQAVSQAAFGAYYVAFILPQLLRQRATWLSGELLFPVLARQVDGRGAGDVYLGAVQFVAALSCPVLIGVALLADDAVQLVFGSGYELAVTPLRILSVAAAIDVFTATATQFFLARRDASAAVRNQAFRLATLAVLLVAVPFTRSINVAAYAVLGSTIFGAAMTAHMMSRRDVSLHGQWTALAPVVGATTLMAGAVMGLSPWLSGWPSIVRPAVLGLVGGVVYVGVGAVVFRPAYTVVFRRLKLLVMRSASQ